MFSRAARPAMRSLARASATRSSLYHEPVDLLYIGSHQHSSPHQHCTNQVTIRLHRSHSMMSTDNEAENPRKAKQLRSEEQSHEFLADASPGTSAKAVLQSLSKALGFDDENGNQKIEAFFAATNMTDTDTCAALYSFITEKPDSLPSYFNNPAVSFPKNSAIRASFQRGLSTVVDQEASFGDGKKLEFDRPHFPDHGIVKELQGDTTALRESAKRKDFLPIMVLGASGMGKTTYAWGGLPSHIKQAHAEENAKSWENWAQVYVMASYCSGDTAASFSESLVERIKTNIEIQMKRSFSFPLEMGMVIVLDEAGPPIETASDLGTISSRLRKEIATEAILVVAGTGLSPIAPNVQSNKDAVKIQLRPWDDAQLQEFVEILCQAEAKVVHQILKSDKVLWDLCTNRRTAFFLVRHIKLVHAIWNPSVSVSGAVETVAMNYLQANGLANLTPAQKRNVARVVLSALKRCKKDDAKVESWPTEIARHCNALVTTHVEKDKVTSLDGFALSISPALALVTFTMLMKATSMTRGWSGLEFIAAMDEVVRLVMNDNSNSSRNEPVPEYDIVQLQSPFPAPNAKFKVKVPVLRWNTVIINGPAAPYADVISCQPWLGQSKFSANKQKVGFSFLDEIEKCGLCKYTEPPKEGLSENDLEKRCKRISIGKFVSSNLMRQWTELKAPSNVAIPNELPHISQEGEVNIKKDQTRHMFPSSLVGYAQPCCNALTMEEHDVDNPLTSEVDQTVTLAFYTNAQCMELDVGRGEKVMVCRNDVNDDGALCDHLPQRQKLESFVATHVSLRFFFAYRF